jgi:hypothetical protein
MRAEELKNITFFIMGQKIRRKDWTCSKSVESKLLSSVFISGQTSTFFYKKGRYHYKGKKRGLFIFNCVKIVSLRKVLSHLCLLATILRLP